VQNQRPFSLACVDLAWGPSRPSTAVLNGTRPCVVCRAPLDEVPKLVDRLTIGALVLLDAPLTPVAKSFRLTDLALMHCGIPCMSPAMARNVGLRVVENMISRRPDIRIFEAYPYQIYKVLAWLFNQGHEQLPSGALLDAGFVTFRPPSYKRSKGTQRDAAFVFAQKLLQLFCSMDAGRVLESVAAGCRADALDALFMACLAELALKHSPWVLVLGDREPRWLILGDQWLLDRLSRHCQCQLYSSTSSEV
jgi:hypothetical protein